MAIDYLQWDIVYPSRYPESLICNSCKKEFTIDSRQACSYCGNLNHASNIITKIRPMILWVGKTNWYKSMTFGIPLSTSGYHTDSHNQAISIADCLFLDKKYEKPMRAVICQATRADASALLGKHKIGQITNQLLKDQIEEKLFKWIFG